MHAWPPPLFLHHPHLPFSLDASAMGLQADALDALPWDQVFDEQEALEDGAVANPDEQRQVGHYWLRSPDRAPTIGQATAITEAAEAVRGFARQVREGTLRTVDGERFTDVLHVGIGGSALGPQLLVDALGTTPEGAARGLVVHFLDNTDPDGIARTLGRLGPRLSTTLVVMVTKSGSTPEPNNALALTRRALAAHATDAPEHLVAVTVQGSALYERATAEGWRAIFPLWPWVGGRFSVTSAVGLLPAELAGLDTQPLLAGAAAMDDWTRTRDWRDNPAALLAGCWHVAGDGRGDRSMVVLPYADRLVTLSRYLQQLVMESLGKDRDRQGREVHQGLTVYGNKGSTDQHAYVQQLRDGRDDFFALFLQVLATDAPDPELSDDVGAGDFLQGFLLGTRRALGERGRPSLTLTVPRVNAEVLGGLVGLFERAVGMYATLVDLNAYHQPGVEAGKRAARHLLDLSRRIRDHLARHDAATVPELAQALDAETTEVLYLCWRLHHTGRLSRNGGALDGRYHLAR